MQACGGDMRATIKALIVANSLFESELEDVYSKASHGFCAGSESEAQGLEPSVKLPELGGYGRRRGDHVGISTMKSLTKPAFSTRPFPRL
jgi:hypothetical protein